MTTPTPLLFTVGDIVIIDDKDKAYIIESRGEIGDLFFKVRFILDNSHLSNVIQARCQVVPIFYSASNFSSRSRTNRHFDVPTHTPALIAETTTRQSPVQILQDTILQTKKFLDRSKASPSTGIHPLMKYINDNDKAKGEGWMRNLFSDAADSSHLKPFESGRLLFIFSLLVGLPRKGGQSHGWSGMLASAWGITL